jgi:hypothetical protein
MGWSDKWLPDTRAALISIRGEGSTSSTDAHLLPALSGLDTVSIIAQFTPAVIDACVRALGTSKERFAVDTDHISDDGGSGEGFKARAQKVFGFVTNLLGLTGAKYISAADYLGGWPTDIAYKRSPLSTTTADTWEIYYDNGEPALLSVCRQAVSEWQRMCNASAAGIMDGAANILGPMGTDEATEFWDSMEALCSTLDVLSENPPASTYDAVSGALRAALISTEQFVGKTLADVSEEVGKTAANVTEGFFKEAGLLAVAVAGIALYLYVR